MTHLVTWYNLQRLMSFQRLCASTTILQTHIISNSMNDFVVLGSELIAQHDIVCITVASLWMLANVLQAIIAGWGFQLNGNVTCKVCRARVDVLGFGINLISKRNNVLCLAIILKATEGEKVY